MVCQQIYSLKEDEAFSLSLDFGPREKVAGIGFQCWNFRKIYVG
jgi:hypothetical protein